MSEENFTWADLLEFAKKLSPDQLKEKVIVWREDEAIKILGAEELSEDYYLDADEEYCMPESEYKQQYIDDPDLEETKLAYKKGFPIMSENF